MDQSSNPMPEPDQHSQTQTAMRNFHVARQWGQLVGTNIRTFDEQNNLICFAKQKAFKLKEEVTFFHDEEQTKPMFKVKARNIIDIAATYDMFDLNGALIGSLRRRGLASAFVRDEWVILNAQDQEVGTITEDSVALGVIRRYVDFVAYVLPQTYSVNFSGQDVGELKQRRNPFTVKYDYSVQSETYNKYPLLILAIPNLLAIIEARQN